MCSHATHEMSELVRNEVCSLVATLLRGAADFALVLRLVRAVLVLVMHFHVALEVNILLICSNLT
jgi:hypothetical protein